MKKSKSFFLHSIRAEELLVLLTVVIVLAVTLYRYNSSTKREPQIHKSELKKSFIIPKERNLSEKVVVNYIMNVINNGSNRLGFQKEGMEGGFIPKEKARDVACYVYELSSKKCSKAYAKDAALFFSSNCAGCHGSDGKGLNGAFPDLTKERLLGLKKK